MGGRSPPIGAAARGSSIPVGVVLVIGGESQERAKILEFQAAAIVGDIEASYEEHLSIIGCLCLGDFRSAPCGHNRRSANEWEKRPPRSRQGGRLPTVLASARPVRPGARAAGGARVSGRGKSRASAGTPGPQRSRVCLNPREVRRTRRVKVEGVHVSLDFWRFPGLESLQPLNDPLVKEGIEPLVPSA